MITSMIRYLLTPGILFVCAFTLTGCDTIKGTFSAGVEVVKDGVDDTFNITCNKPLGAHYVALQHRLDHAVTALESDQITITRYDAISAQIDLYRADLRGFKVEGSCDQDPDRVHLKLDEIDTYFKTIDEELNYEEPG